MSENQISCGKTDLVSNLLVPFSICRVLDKSPNFLGSYFLILKVGIITPASQDHYIFKKYSAWHEFGTEPGPY